MIKAILFDFGQTLADSAEGFRLAEKGAETRMFEDLGLASWQDFLSDYRKARQEFHANSNFSRVALWQGIYLHYGRGAGAAFLQVIEHDYWETVRSKTRLFPETKAVLGQLASGYRLALITNTQGQGISGGHRISLFPDLETFFEIIIVAGEAGVPPKPNRTPFLICLEKLGLLPSEAVYVGDDLRIDIRGAQNVGIQPIWLKHHSVPRKWPEVETSAPVINSLEQLVPLLERICHSFS
ncbi:MAG: HAD family hydrolase [Anaerolineales bacterium]|nr:MAG: HAD family hydrolase [Anaerolineales bacterium]